ncbi:Protein CBR-RSP-1 [Caenorhabditis briggsae]|uniref:RRM domain-containing protein n=2 Tax=Caenorhabditis briggsae TaxID=6238 RepID=A0AAE9DKL5_CAEBR|nr:Protein CBR-RSP-1 [Caenorhabditis briggsae]ULU06144.1 hypothetical protein L3Y34_018199 [Caenorhabditis briggsae]UMM18090.1 hypothetical protein L5515_014321 [Caenorhabditis briggsae]CAP23711.1 Protein CBR-RSP-1 [Caenorhabditis briggsae]
MAARIYIGRLTSRVSEKDIEHFFRGYGQIRDVLLKNGFGFVEFDDKRDAEDAVHDLNGKELGGDRVILDYSKPRGGGGSGGGYGDRRGGGRVSSYSGGGGRDRFDRYDRGPPRRESRYGRPYSTRHRVLVENLSSRISWQDLKDQVRRQGVEPTYAEAHKRPNEALLCFATPSDLKRCIDKCDGMDLNGRKIKMVDDSQAGSGRSRSRSHSRSRSRSRDRRRSRSRSSSRSKSRSRSPVKRAKRESKSRSRSRSRSADGRKSRSPSKSPRKDRSASPARRSRSPSEKGSPRRSRSASPMDNGDN